MKYVFIIFVCIITASSTALSTKLCDICSWKGDGETSLGTNLKEPDPTPTQTPTPLPSPLKSPSESKSSVASTGFGQEVSKISFLEIANSRTKQRIYRSIDEVCPLNHPVTARILREYGAIYVAEPRVIVAYKCILDNEDDVQAFQQAAQRTVEQLGGTQVTLQKPAMDALIAARLDAAKKGLSITPRGGAAASTRSYSTTLDLWRSRFIPGLSHWVKKGKIKREEAVAAQNAPINTQIATVLKWEAKGMYFSKDLSKSILYSVAAPGASQHIFMLALDVEQFGNPEVRKIMARHGWFQTVKSDLPHFTFLGAAESELPSLGLKPVTIGSQKFWIPNID